MHQNDGAGADAVRDGRGEGRLRRRLVQCLDFRAMHVEAAANLHRALVQQGGHPDVQVEQPRPGLVADAQGIGEPAAHHQQRPLATPFQQRIGGDGGAHLHRVDRAGGDRRRGIQSQDAADARDGCVLVEVRILAQQLVRGEVAGRVAGDEVGEGAAAVDPELPACH